MLDWTLNVQCNGALQRLCYSCHDLRPVNQVRCWRNEPRSFQKGEHKGNEEKSLCKRNEVWAMFCIHLQHDTKNTGQSRWLFIRASATTRVVSKEADEMPSAVVADQTSMGSWNMNCECCQEETMSPPVDVSTVLSRPHPPLAVFTRSLHPYITHFEHMVILTKIPNPHHRQAERPNGLRTSR